MMTKREKAIPKGTPVNIEVDRYEPPKGLKKSLQNKAQGHDILRVFWGQFELGKIDHQHLKILMPLTLNGVIETQFYVEEAEASSFYNISLATLKCKIYLKTDAFTEPEAGYDYKKSKRFNKQKERQNLIEQNFRNREAFFKLATILRIKRNQEPVIKGWEDICSKDLLWKPDIVQENDKDRNRVIKLIDTEVGD